MPRPESDEGLRPVAALTSISSAVTCWEWNGTNVVFAYDSERERDRDRVSVTVGVTVRVRVTVTVRETERKTECGQKQLRLYAESV